MPTFPLNYSNQWPFVWMMLSCCLSVACKFSLEASKLSQTVMWTESLAISVLSALRSLLLNLVQLIILGLSLIASSVWIPVATMRPTTLFSISFLTFIFLLELLVALLGFLETLCQVDSHRMDSWSSSFDTSESITDARSLSTKCLAVFHVVLAFIRVQKQVLTEAAWWST